MRVVVVANPKGGVGKSTVSTQIAGWWAQQGHRVMLGDVDLQQSARGWLELRPPQAAPIQSWSVERDHVVAPPVGTTHVVLDTPAGLKGKRLSAVLAVATHVLVPVPPGLFDINATDSFLAALRAHPAAARLAIGLLAVKTREGTLASQRLMEYLGTLPWPVLGAIRDTQTYVHLAAHGLTLWDVAPARVARDREQWAPVLEWLDAPLGRRGER